MVAQPPDSEGGSACKFVKATIDDMPQAEALANAVFGGVNTIPLDRRIERLQKNPDIDYLLKREDQIVGYFSLVPLRSATIDDHDRGRWDNGTLLQSW